MNIEDDSAKTSSFPKHIINGVDLNGDFGDAFSKIFESSDNFFITGKAGTGKSTLLRYFADTTNKNVVKLSFTGISAVNIGGQTIHSFFGFPIHPLSKEDIKESRKREMFSALEAIIIDEISMVRADLFDAIDQFMRINGKNPTKPFGGVQMLFFGDPFQLQPVVTDEEVSKLFSSYYKSPYFFDSKVFENLDYEIINLEHVYRQSDRAFIHLLDSVRTGNISINQLNKINERYQPKFVANQENPFITITSTNKIANEINQSRLDEIMSDEFEYWGIIQGRFRNNNLPTEMVLKFKVGAQVMFVRNDSKNRWVNGTIGKVTALSEEHVEVEADKDGEIYTYSVGTETWESLKYEYDYDSHTIKTEVVGSFTQYPLKLAWAVTIHKSQGLTFENVVIDLGSGAFAHGQTYVALSRCIKLDGIILKKKIRRSDIIIDYPVKKFYSTIQK